VLSFLERGECDVVLVHDKARELQFMRNGFGSVRREVMYNDFVVVGPRDDPAKVDAMHDAVVAFRKIAAAKARFVARGDLNGTEAAEERLWAEAGGLPVAARDLWYVKTGGGMEQTLATAASTNGYALTDRGTWGHFRNRGELKIVVEDDPRLFNQYAIILVNPVRYHQVKAQMGMVFIDWLTSPAGQAKIASYKVDSQQLFFPDYVKPQVHSIAVQARLCPDRSLCPPCARGLHPSRAARHRQDRDRQSQRRTQIEGLQTSGARRRPLQTFGP
jgi:tungstate transport system substrate-binding protein